MGRPFRLTINIPAPFFPMDRLERFEDPLMAALEDLGEVDGGGSELKAIDGRWQIASCYIDVAVDDLERALPIVRESLRASTAPAGTTITQHGPQTIVHRL